MLAENSGFTGERDITPAWLAAIPRQSRDLRREREGRTLLARLLRQIAVWSDSDVSLFNQNLASSMARWKSNGATEPVREASPNPPRQLCELVRELAYRCGLSTGDIQSIRVSGIEAAGLRKQWKSRHWGVVAEQAGDRVIPFGDGWDNLRKALLDAYVSAERPSDYLFFSRSPRDKRKRISRQTLEAAVASLEKNATVRSLRERHFREDFNRSRDLRELRFHLRNVHGLNNGHVHQLISGALARREGFVSEASTFPVPQPYFVAAICASGVLPKRPVVRPEANKRSHAEWLGLLGRYSVTLDWPTDFVTKLQDRGRRRDRALRVLYRAAWNQWHQGRRMKPMKIQTADCDDRELLEGFAKTNVEVVDKETGAAWSGAMFEFRNRKRTSYIPLIEVMNGGAWRNQCKVCMHPDRATIDRDIRQAQASPKRVKGLKKIATNRVSYQSLLGHAGVRHTVPWRGEFPRTHLGSAITAPTVQCPRSVADKAERLSANALAVLPLLLSTELHPRQSEIIVAGSVVEKALGISLNENRLSLALADLRNHGVVSMFERVAGGFRVVLPTP